MYMFCNLSYILHNLVGSNTLDLSYKMHVLTFDVKVNKKLSELKNVSQTCDEIVIQVKHEMILHKTLKIWH